ncbi:MAG: thioredoxin [Bacteroidota bacterium]
MDVINFQTDVIEKSQEIPVVVDFWAPWCGPCQVLGPVIEQMAQEADDKWTLVKVNSDQHPEVSQAYKVMSIPAVKLFYQGEVKAEFNGALPRHMIQKWLDDHLPDPLREALNDIRNQLQQVDERDTAIARLQDLLKDYPNDHNVRLLLASAWVLTDAAASQQLIEGLHFDAQSLDLKQDLESMYELGQVDIDTSSQAGQKLQATQLAFEANQTEDGLGLLIEAVMMDKNLHNELPRRVGVALFRSILGPVHPLTKKYRRRFDMALY